MYSSGHGFKSSTCTPGVGEHLAKKPLRNAVGSTKSYFDGRRGALLQPTACLRKQSYRLSSRMLWNDVEGSIKRKIG
jgi:hypothetical protein